MQVAQLWQRDRMSLEILMGWVTLRPNFRLKGYCFVPISMECEIGKWLCYNLLLEVFTQRNVLADFIRLKSNFIFKNKQNRF